VRSTAADHGAELPEQDRDAVFTRFARASDRT
jgi:hypothetical protein